MSQPEPCIFCGGDTEALIACCDDANYGYDVEEVAAYIESIWGPYESP